MRTTLSALIALSLLALTACTEPVGEQPPGPDAPEGTESGGVVAGTSAQEMVHHGAAFTETDAIKAKELLADPGAFSDGTILIEGTIVDISQAGGGWLVLSDGANQIRVVAKDFAVDGGSIGAWMKAEGQLAPVEADAAVIERMAAESSRPELMPEKAGVEYQFLATGASIEKR